MAPAFVSETGWILASSNVERVDAIVPNASVWLAGPRASENEVGVRGYRYPSFDGSSAPALDAYVFVLYVSGTTQIEREIRDSPDRSCAPHGASAAALVERCEVGPGDISLQPPLVNARWRWHRPIDVLHVYIDPAYVRAILSEELGAIPSLQMRHGLRINDDALVQMGVDLIHESVDKSKFGARRSARAIGERMTLHLLRNYFDIGNPSSRSHAFLPEQANALRSFVDAHLEQRLHVEDLARVVGLGVHHFSRMFRDTFAQAPHEYVRDRRVERARNLVLTTTRSICDIAASTGFSDQSHLTRCFKQRFGMPPAELRRRARNDD